MLLGAPEMITRHEILLKQYLYYLNLLIFPSQGSEGACKSVLPYLDLIISTWCAGSEGGISCRPNDSTCLQSKYFNFLSTELYWNPACADGVMVLPLPNMFDNILYGWCSNCQYFAFLGTSAIGILQHPKSWCAGSDCNNVKHFRLLNDVFSVASFWQYLMLRFGQTLWPSSLPFSLRHLPELQMSIVSSEHLNVLMHMYSKQKHMSLLVWDGLLGCCHMCFCAGHVARLLYVVMLSNYAMWCGCCEMAFWATV